jgi:hypothetical protein
VLIDAGLATHADRCAELIRAAEVRQERKLDLQARCFARTQRAIGLHRNVRPWYPPQPATMPAIARGDDPVNTFRWVWTMHFFPDAQIRSTS